MDMTPIYLDRLGITAGLVDNVKPDHLSNPTPCADFDVHRLLNHIIGGASGLAMAVAGQGDMDPKASPPDFVTEAGGDASTPMKNAVEMARSAWTAEGALEQESVPVGAGMPAKMALRIALLEAVVHGWDLAKATDQAYEIPDQLAEPMLSGLIQAFGNAPREPGGFFGPAVAVPDDASAADKLIAFTGRTP